MSREPERGPERRTPFAPRPAGADPAAADGIPSLRQPATPGPGAAARAARILLAPLAAALAALAGLLFVVLLPICGIASIASAVAQASWALVRDALGGARPRAARRG